MIDELSIDNGFDEDLNILDDQLNEDICPECRSPLEVTWSGVKCNNCGYWFCL